MIYKDLCSERVSMLGFGTMRLPVVKDSPTHDIDEAACEKMFDEAVSSGVNYFDTAWPYHSGESERVIGKILKKYPRDSYYLATKYPGHQTAETYDPASVFERQLEKCCVDYFDFYLLHNVNENCIDVYRDERWGIIEYFIEQKRNGRIRHLGFSTHGGVQMLKEFLDEYGENMEFCQIQLNYLDDTLQNAREKYEILTARDIPVIVMEPLRGGKLASLSFEQESMLKSLRPDKSIASWAFNWFRQFENVSVVLSGMSDMAQLKDNVKTFSEGSALSGEENEVLSRIAESMKSSLPCTSCRYCTDTCPASLDIPHLIGIYNELAVLPSVTAAMRLEGKSEGSLPSACIGCGACSKICPQKIDIPKAMADLAETLKKLPKWADICKERAAAQK